MGTVLTEMSNWTLTWYKGIKTALKTNKDKSSIGVEYEKIKRTTHKKKILF